MDRNAERTEMTDGLIDGWTDMTSGRNMKDRRTDG